LLAACDNFTPRSKEAQYDPVTKRLVMPHPCPDWSQSQTANYRNEPHSNYGCAVNTNMAVQLADPSDLHRGKGNGNADAETTANTIKMYRAGDIPQPLSPMQSTGAQ
jgi:pilus assembly protein CpaD